MLADMFAGAQMDRFSMPLKRAFAGTVGVEIDDRGTVPFYEETKDDLIPFLGCSYRQWQIDFSEKFMKPRYGNDIFARLFVQRNRDSKARLIAVPDSGFKEEADPVANAFGLENTILIRIHCPGYTFSGDSRSYISDISPNEHDVYNDGDSTAYREKLWDIVGDFLQK